MMMMTDRSQWRRSAAEDQSRSWRQRSVCRMASRKGRRLTLSVFYFLLRYVKLLRI